MIICVCHEWSEAQIRQAIAIYELGTFQDLQDLTNISSTCGKCHEMVQCILKEEIAGGQLENVWPSKPEQASSNLVARSKINRSLA